VLILDSDDAQAWLYSPGMPPVGNQFDATLMTEAAALADKWHFGDVMGLGTTSFHERGAADLDGWAGEKVT
jgi:leukotriene-A4 hydrolase